MTFFRRRVFYVYVYVLQPLRPQRQWLSHSLIFGGNEQGNDEGNEQGNFPPIHALAVRVWPEALLVIPFLGV